MMYRGTGTTIFINQASVVYISNRVPLNLRISLAAGTTSWSSIPESDRFYYETGARGGSQDPESFPDLDDPSESLIIRVQHTEPGAYDDEPQTPVDTELYDAYRASWVGHAAVHPHTANLNGKATNGHKPAAVLLEAANVQVDLSQGAADGLQVA